MESPSQTYKIELSQQEAQMLGFLLAHLVEENPPFWRNEEGKIERMRYGPIRLCVSVIDQLSKQLGSDSSSDGGTFQTVN